MCCYCWGWIKYIYHHPFLNIEHSLMLKPQTLKRVVGQNTRHWDRARHNSVMFIVRKRITYNRLKCSHWLSKGCPDNQQRTGAQFSRAANWKSVVCIMLSCRISVTWGYKNSTDWRKKSMRHRVSFILLGILQMANHVPENGDSNNCIGTGRELAQNTNWEGGNRLMAYQHTAKGLLS